MCSMNIKLLKEMGAYNLLSVLLIYYYQKLRSRQSELKRSSVKQKEKWAKMLVMEMMSSDESDGEIIKIKELPWRSGKANEFINALEEGIAGRQSGQALRQTKQRVVQGISSRPRPPATAALPSWAFNTV